MKNKIGIITFSRVNNYGALLQCYALKTLLQQMGGKVEVLNYFSPALEAWHNPNPFIFRTPKQLLKKLILFPYSLFVHSRFSPFMKKYLDGNKILTKNELRRVEKDFSHIITGSDQVFNLALTGNDTTYLLDFVSDKNKKFSYAASFGTATISEKSSNIYRELLNSFSQISVREEHSVTYLENLGFKKVEVNIDPTLCLSLNNWKKLADTKKISGDYILFYSASDDLEILSYVKALSQKTNLPIYYCSGQFIHLPLKAKHLLCTPEQWLGYFLKAKYVVTNSFHGLSFCINFKKQFAISLLPPAHKGNIRLQNLLDMTQLHDRLIKNIGFNLDKSINWTQADSFLNINREKSYNYLYQIVSK